jgi:mRNA deadenylase 3'-5' endonuclease subunit Ccr4
MNIFKECKSDLSHSLNLSAYDNFEFTYQGNCHESNANSIDFVFYERSLFKLTKIFEQPSTEKISKTTPLPNEYTPSDHLPIIFEFCLT